MLQHLRPWLHQFGVAHRDMKEFESFAVTYVHAAIESMDGVIFRKKVIAAIADDDRWTESHQNWKHAGPLIAHAFNHWLEVNSPYRYNENPIDRLSAPFRWFIPDWVRTKNSY